MPPSIDVTDDPADFEEAVRAFRRRVPMPDWKWDALTEAEREFAFKVSGAAQADLATQAWEAMDRAIRDGTTLADFKREVGAQLEAAWGKADPARLETIFRTNALGAYNAGRHEILNHPEVKKARPYWRFDAVGDDRTTEVCLALDGTIRPADDPFWHTHSPPLHFQCRSILVPLSQEEAEEEGIDEKAPEGDADEGFGKQPSGDEPGGGWEPDAKEYPAPIGEILEQKLELVPEPPPEPPEPDHAPAFVKVDPEPPPERLPEMDKPKWVMSRHSDDPVTFIADNEDTLTRASKALQGVTGTGTPSSAYAAKEMDNRGEYNSLTGVISIKTDLVKLIQGAVKRGVVTSREEESAFRTVMHEQFHAASNQNYVYAAHGRAMEEGTTELLAQHYKGDFPGMLGIKSELPADVPLFRAGPGGGPVMNRAASYSNFIQSFAQLVSYVDDVAVTDHGFQKHVAGRALQVKRLKGAPEADQRYGLFTRRILDKRGIKASHQEYGRISENINRMVQEYMQSMEASPNRVAFLDEWIGRVVNGENYR